MTMMDLDLGSRPRRSLHVAAAPRDFFEESFLAQSGAILLDPIEAASMPLQQPKAPQRSIVRNATFIAGLMTFAVLDPSPTIARSVVSYDCLGAIGSAWNVEDTAVDDATIASNRARIEAGIESYRQLADDWDGDDGVAPSSEAAASALAFLTILKDQLLPQAVHPVGDGEIVFQWRDEGSFIEAAFNGKTISWYARTGDGPAVFGDDDIGAAPAFDDRLMTSIAKIRDL